MHAEVAVLTAQYACNSMHVRSSLSVNDALSARLKPRVKVADGKHSKHQHLQ